jgi:LuxR family maltose regulon positive regulatory protein
MKMPEVIARGTPCLLLATKLLPPRLAAGLIDRPRLIELAAHAENRRLTVIKAPAGFGKTSLALAWFNQLRTSGAHVAWLSLDTDDDEPARFLHHLAQALRHACGNVGASAIGLTAQASLVPAQSIAATLINELVEVDEEVYLFLDDYHLINLPVIHDVVAFFIEHVPSHVHLVVCTRIDSNLPLARLRASNELLEIDASNASVRASCAVPLSSRCSRAPRVGLPRYAFRPRCWYGKSSNQVRNQARHPARPGRSPLTSKTC